jgi:hypothetical protein
MSYKPEDFFISVMEFFAILMPGALLTFLWLDNGIRLFKETLPFPPGQASLWIAFFVSSYILGHLLHHIGGILDKLIYDKLYVKRWKRRKGEEQLLTKTHEIMKKTLQDDASMTSAFSWASSFVRAHNKYAANELERGGAESKFFRSLVFVSAIAAIKFFINSSPDTGISALALFIFALWRFCDRRWNSAQLTYEYFILLHDYSNNKRNA